MKAAALALATLLTGCGGGRLVRGGDVDRSALAVIESRLPALRGLAFKAPVPARAMRPDEIAVYLAHDIDRTYAAGELERLTRIYARLGLLPPGVALRPAMERLYQGQVAAFYDPRTKQLVVGTQAVKEAGIGVKVVSLLTGRDLVGELLVSHELVHALQDQHWGIPVEPEPLTDSHGDRLLARRALLEGDATLSGFAYVQGGTPSAGTLKRIEHELTAVGPTMASEYPEVPEVVRAGLAFQYDAGTAFAGWALGAGGWPAVDRAEADPPTSTEQVLHPARYFGVRDRPVEIALGGTEALEADGWTRAVEDTLGELDVRVLAGRAFPPPRAAAIADGWGGDRLRALARGDGLVLVWMTAWDSPAEAEEFFQAMPAIVPAARTERRDTRVLVLLGPDGGPSLDALATRVWARTTTG